LASWLGSRFQRDPDLVARLLFAFAAILLIVAALLRTWASSYLRAGVVYAAEVKTDSLVADGPYLLVRNPLYFANVLMVTGMGAMRSKIVDNEPEKNQHRQIGFRNVRAPQIFKKQRVALQKPHDGINQVSEQNRESENRDDGAGDVHNRQQQPEQQRGHQYIQGAAIWERHIHHLGGFDDCA
jgi:hypothetical protein